VPKRSGTNDRAAVRSELCNGDMDMMLRSLRIALAGCLFALTVGTVHGDAQILSIPPLTAHVTDLTGTFDVEQKQTLESDLTALEQRKGSQLGVLLLPTTQPEDIAQFGIRVGDAWKLGRKGTDDGVILIVAKDDRRVRIEVGRGLEGAIPDAAAARIIREYVTPKFRADDYYGGVHDAVDALTKLIDGEPLPPPLVDDVKTHDGVDIGNAAIFVLFIMFWARGLFGGLSAPPRSGLVAAVGAGAAWFLSGGVVPLVVGLGVVGLILGLIGGTGGGFANRGGWGGLGGGGGGFGGGGGGGGFSGGGGGFSGGGASGSW
jgi:uncharacterized protein